MRDLDFPSRNPRSTSAIRSPYDSNVNVASLDIDGATADSAFAV
jgi:hypothetical protein